MSRNLGIVIAVLGLLFVILHFTGIYDIGDFKWAAVIAVLLGGVMVFAAMKQQQ